MIGSITPLGERPRNPLRWIKRALTYTGAAAMAGATMGFLMAQLGNYPLGRISGAGLLSGLALLAFVYSLHELGFLRLPVPSSGWQVPVEWANWGYYRSALVWGVTLGTGLATRMPFPAYFVLLGWLIVVGNPYYGLAVGGGYGFARAVPVLLAGTLQVTKHMGYANPVPIVQSRAVWHPLNGVALLAFAGLLSGLVLVEG